MKIIGLLRNLSEVRKKSPAAIDAAGKGLERKPGFGRYGPIGRNLVTKKSIGSALVNIPPHPVGKKALMKGVPAQPYKP